MCLCIKGLVETVQVEQYSTKHMHVCVCVCTQLCQTLCHLMDCRPPGSSVHGISQARILKWIAISFFRGRSQPRDRNHVSRLLHWQSDSLLLSHLGSPTKHISA